MVRTRAGAVSSQEPHQQPAYDGGEQEEEEETAVGSTVQAQDFSQFDNQPF